jgi:hypothetical protein
MTEEQAREAAKLIKELDNIVALGEKIHKNFGKAKQGDSESLEWLTNTAFILQNEVIDYIKKDISNI